MGFLNKEEKDRLLNIKKLIKKAARIQRLYDEDAPKKQKVKQLDQIMEELNKAGITFDKLMESTFVVRKSVARSEIDRKMVILWDQKPRLQLNDQRYFQEYWNCWEKTGFLDPGQLKIFQNIFYKYNRPRHSKEIDLWF